MKLYLAIKTKAIAPFLMLLAILLFVSSCSTVEETNKVTSSEEETTAFSAVASTEIVTEVTRKPREADFGSMGFRILAAAEQWEGKYFVEEADGDIMRDAVYVANSAVSEKYNVEIKYDVVNGYMAGMLEVQTRLKNSVMAGDKVYDLFVASSAYVGGYILEGVFADLSGLSDIDFSAPWWYASVNYNLTVNSRLYVCSGSYNFGTISRAWGVFFNKQLAANLNLPDSYKAVEMGEWTFDYMIKNAKAANADVDGDGIYTDADRYGILGTVNEPFCALPYGMGRLITNVGDDGLPHLTGASPKMVSIMDKLQDLWSDKSLYYGTKETAPADKLIPMFSDGRSLFMVYTLNIVEIPEMRESVDFGILPLPKYDLEQEKYYTSSFSDISAIPLVVQDFEMSSLILEALSYEYYENVVPQYYNIALTRKLTRDNDSAEMINIIVDGSVMEFGKLFYAQLEPSLYHTSSIFSDRRISYATWWAEKGEAIEVKLDDLIKRFTQLEE